MADTRIGVSGFSYASWRKGAFFPEGLARRRELEWLSRRVNSIEINGSFYSLLKPQTYASYRDATPRGFVFAVKGSRFITHLKRLRDVATPLANFLASGVLRLEEKLGPVVWQLPGTFSSAEPIEPFLELLPRDTMAASKRARRHDKRVSGRASMAVDANRTIRHALEVRHRDLMTDELVSACRRHDVALVFSDNGGDWPYCEEITAGWCYLRLHGSPETYASDYGARALDGWAKRIRAWSTGKEPSDSRRITSRKPPGRKARDVYVYFDNDGEAHAPSNAVALAKKLQIEWCALDATEQQRSASRGM